MMPLAISGPSSSGQDRESDYGIDVDERDASELLSEYGSDIDESALSELVNQAESQASNAPVLESIEDLDRFPHATFVPRKRRTKILVDEDGVSFEVLANDGPIREPSVEIEYDQSNRGAFSPRKTSSRKDESPAMTGSQEHDPANDSKTPLERFRTPPKKTMSVTDLVSPAWCELQYWYSLTKYGRVKKTPAMRQGSEVHKVLEEQVHTAIPVEVVTKEDRFGLRIWNIIQGLRTLRATGMTREFEVWGVIEGQVVNGVIDELSYTCPDEELEARIGVRRNKSAKPIPADQSTVDTFFAKKDAETARTGSNSRVDPSRHKPKKVYLTDIKTRGSGKAPTSEVSLRPTYMQLMLYHKLLELLASNSIPAQQVFERYFVDGETTFSDTFITQIGGLDYNFHDRADQEHVSPFNSSQDSVDELLAHNSLNSLWSLMMEEFGRTLPTRSTDGCVGDVLRAEFRMPGSGKIVGVRSFAYDSKVIDAYIRREMAWWSGERPTRGVDVEEAFKCRICEFAEGCTWRKEKVDEGLQKARLRHEERRRSEV